MTPSSGIASIDKKSSLKKLPSPMKQRISQIGLQSSSNQPLGDKEDYITSLAQYNSYSVNRKNK